MPASHRNHERHKNRFRVESEFLDHYERARKIARYPGNAIRSCDGEDILGRAKRVSAQELVRDATGRVQWEVLPRTGAVPTADGKVWMAVPFLAPHLQSTLINTDPATGMDLTSMRITPEVRLERSGISVRPVRVLTLEIMYMNEDGKTHMNRARAQQFRDGAADLLKLWYPLHEEAKWEWKALPPQESGVAAGLFVTNLLLRFRAPHDSLTEVV